MQATKKGVACCSGDEPNGIKECHVVCPHGIRVGLTLNSR